MRSKELFLKESFVSIGSRNIDKNVIDRWDQFIGETSTKAILKAMEEYADEKLGDFISKQNSFTETIQVPKQILDQYAKEVAIEFRKWEEDKYNNFFKAYQSAECWEDLDTEAKMRFDQLPIELKFNQFLQETKQDK